MVEVWPPRNVPSRRGIWYFCEFGSSAPFNCNPHKNFQEYLIRAKMQLRCHQPCCHTFETDVTNLLSRMSLSQHTRTILMKIPSSHQKSTETRNLNMRLCTISIILRDEREKTMTQASVYLPKGLSITRCRRPSEHL